MRFHDLCKYYANHSQWIVKVVALSYLVIIGLYLTPSILEYFASARVIPCMSLYLRGKEQTTTIGFAILMVYNYSALISCYLTLVSVDMLMIVVLANIPMLSEMVIFQLDDLKLNLENVRCDRDIKFRIHQIIMMHYRYNR